MTKGLVIFAINNELVDYRSMAQWSARRINKILDLPVTLITDQPFHSSDFDHVIVQNSLSQNKKFYSDYHTVATWHNTIRHTVYDLTPYDQTILLDADYVVNSDRLGLLFDSHCDFLCHDTACDLAGSGEFNSNNSFGAFQMPMQWATVIYFTKTQFAQAVFEIMAMVKDNWTHYRNLYQISNAIYRNDHALSMAMTVLDHGHRRAIPWNLLTILPEQTLQMLGHTKWQIKYQQAGKNSHVSLIDRDFHALNKQQLSEIIANE